MVEEMYKEEAGDNAEMDSTSSSEIATKGSTKTSEDRVENIQQPTTSTSTVRCSTGQFFEPRSSDHLPDVDMVGPTASFQNVGHTEGKSTQRANVDERNFYQDSMVQPNGGTQRFMAAAAYHVADPGRFNNGGGVSLTLGLHREDAMGSVGAHHGFMTFRGDEVYDAPGTSAGTENADFDCLESGSTRQHNGFGSSHLLHDFVA